MSNSTRPMAPTGIRYPESGPPKKAGAPRRGPSHRRASRFAFWFPRRWPLKTLLLPPLAVLILASTSIVGAWQSPGNQNFSAKWADWLRSHHEAALSKEVEQIYYNANKPKTGGTLTTLNKVPSTEAPVVTLPSSKTAVSTPVAKKVVPSHLPAPKAVPLVVTPAVPGEGQWAPAGPLVKGVPAMYVAQFRADQIYTSQITTAVWIDPTLLNVNLVPGSQEPPDETWSIPPYITDAELPAAVAAFNGGFRFADAHGGFYLDGRTAVPLRVGAASMVIYNNGKVNVGTWGTEVTMTPNVTAVLQNLVPIVDNGQPAAAATYNDSSIWGATLGAATVVARSGLGVTATGALVYVAGPALTARSLAESLQRAGAIRAMSLDINPEWVTFNFFTHPDPAHPSTVAPSKLYPTMERPADRYLGPTHESRDFFTVSVP